MLRYGTRQTVESVLVAVSQREGIWNRLCKTSSSYEGVYHHALKLFTLPEECRLCGSQVRKACTSVSGRKYVVGIRKGIFPIDSGTHQLRSFESVMFRSCVDATPTSCLSGSEELWIFSRARSFYISENEIAVQAGETPVAGHHIIRR